MIININEYKTRKRIESYQATFDNVFTFWVNMFIHYIFYPTVAATATIMRKRPIVL